MKIAFLSGFLALILAAWAHANNGTGTGAPSGASTPAPGAPSGTATPSPGTANGAASGDGSRAEGALVVNPSGNTPVSPSVNPSASPEGVTSANPAPATGTDVVHSPRATLSRSQVLDAQRALSANGFTVTQDGVAGPATMSAVKRFQAQRGLPQTGELDNRTMQELNAATQSTPPSQQKAGESAPTL